MQNNFKYGVRCIGIINKYALSEHDKEIIYLKLINWGIIITNIETAYNFVFHALLMKI